MSAMPHCQVCGCLPEDGTRSVAVTVPITDYRGRPLEHPAVHFACRKCRQAIFVAEQAQKVERKADGTKAVPTKPPKAD